MVFPELPAEVASKVKGLFRSEKRQKIALELLFFDHWPEKDERREIASRYDLELTGIDKILYNLRDAAIFTKKQGSIPLYRARMKEEGVDIDVDDSIDSEDASSEENNLDRRKIESSHEELESKTDKLESKTDNKDRYGNRINAIDVKIYDFEQTLDSFMAEMRTTVNKLSTSNPATEENPGSENPALVQPESVEGRLERIEGLLQESENRDPFDDLNREQIIELIRSQPQEVMTMANPRSAGQSGRVEGQTVTLRPMILMLTTYSQMLYERAVYDGYFEGTLSDFVNFAMEQYFTDRGWGLDWNKREPANMSRRFS